MLNRRGFIAGIIAAAAAPMIIRTPGLLMPVKPSLIGSLPPDWWPKKFAISHYRGKTRVMVEIESVDGFAVPLEVLNLTDIPAAMLTEKHINCFTGQQAWDKGLRYAPTQLVRPVMKTERDLDPHDGSSAPIMHDDFSEKGSGNRWPEGSRPCAVYHPNGWPNEVRKGVEWYDEEVISTIEGHYNGIDSQT